MLGLSLLMGAVVGLSLGLTGGGGAIFAVPLLVYGLHVPTTDAVGISLTAVGVTSFVGFVHRWKLGEVEIPTGVLFSIAGMLGAPVGTWIAHDLPEAVLLLLFAGLMVIVAVRLWLQAARPASPATACPISEHLDAPTCQRNTAGVLILNSRCTVLLLIVGLLTGVLSGLFGVGGGFIIVPALVLFSGMAIQRAVGTSLMVIALVSASGAISQLWSERNISPSVTSGFVIGGIVGLLIGQKIGRYLSGPLLQKIFVVAILAVAIFVIVRNLST